MLLRADLPGPGYYPLYIAVHVFYAVAGQDLDDLFPAQQQAHDYQETVGQLQRRTLQEADQSLQQSEQAEQRNARLQLLAHRVSPSYQQSKGMDGAGQMNLTYRNLWLLPR